MNMPGGKKGPGLASTSVTVAHSTRTRQRHAPGRARIVPMNVTFLGDATLKLDLNSKLILID